MGFAYVSPAVAEAPAEVSAIRFGEDGGMTRVVIDANVPIRFSVSGQTESAQRIIVDLPRVRWRMAPAGAERGEGGGAGLVSAYRYATGDGSSSQVILDLKRPSDLVRSFAIPGDPTNRAYRIVLDLKSAGEASPVQSAISGSGRPEGVNRRVIVIDPGHGGRDPGAISAGGISEKDVTLAIARTLREELAATGRYDVRLTRSGDEFIELDDRVEKARSLGADLFISLHADAGGDRLTRGASVYTLSPEGEKRAERARRQNDWVLAVETDRSRPAEVNDILADLVQRETKNQSDRFAQLLLPALSDAGWPALQNPHRRRGFFVLLSPDVPAVLLEMGFLTNPQDEKMLLSQTRRTHLANGIVKAIDAFFGSNGSTVAQR
jgi:N-acetylmuramoyl-L-alanine amidase